MKGKLGPVLWMACGGLLVVIIGLVAWSAGWIGGPVNPPNDEELVPHTVDPVGGKVIAKEGDKKEAKDSPKPTKPPKEVPDPDRVKQNLKEGKTYETKLTGGLNVRAKVTEYGIKKIVFINYAFGALIDREIEKNDGKTIVELRHFRDMKSVRVQTELEDVRIDLDSVGGGLLSAIPVVPAFFKRLSGLSLKPALVLLRKGNQSPEEFLKSLIGDTGAIAADKLGELSKTFQAVTTMDSLSGKKVRLTYVNGKGIKQVESVKGDMTLAERAFHEASVLLSDSATFGNFIDPSLLARTRGEIVMTRDKDRIVQGKKCLHVAAKKGTMHLEDWNPQAGTLGHFSPRGSMFFSPEDQIIIQSKLQGSAVLERFSTNHLLFASKLIAEPELELRYSCTIKDSK